MRALGTAPQPKERLCSKPFWALLLVALLFRLHGLVEGDVWVDEANGVLTAGQSLAGIVGKLSLDSSPPLYYFLLHFWMAVFGDSPAAVRLLSVLLSLPLVAAVTAVGMRFWSRGAGLWAGLLVASSPVAAWNGQQARMYALLPLLALGALWCLVRYLREGRPRDLVLAWLATVAALYTHNFALYLLPIQALLVASSGQLRRRWRQWLLGLVGLAAACAPWLPVFLEQLSNRDHYAWFLPLWQRYGPLGCLWKTLLSFSPAGEFLMYERIVLMDLWGVPALVVAGFALAGCVALVRRRRALGAVEALWLPLWLGVPVLASLAASLLVTPHYVPGRVDQMLFPAYALLAGIGIAGLRPPLLQQALAPALLLVACVGKSGLYVDYSRLGYAGTDSDLAAAIARRLSPDDVILCTSLTRGPLMYYLGRAGVAARVLSYPRDTARHLGAQNDQRLFDDQAGLRREAEIVVHRARAAAGKHGRLLLLRSTSRVNDQLSRDSLLRRFGVQEEQVLGRYVQTGTLDVIRVSRNRFYGQDGT